MEPHPDPHKMREDLIRNLTQLASAASLVSAQLIEYGCHPEVLSDECRKHAHELRGAAGMLGNWAASI